ncbi:hypothetical protein KIN20_004228 [Parelaphostrongylus tenuis]|uniref:Uncharacterized protein n=1 Tax=Parelaphostrongylus tenuis TaxID=148309 RepID=A0AAD5QHX2_PARTN|nr:hypothetical protein KIN20_004228 [Parelaphostrongylus tenuis]
MVEAEEPVSKSQFQPLRSVNTNKSFLVWGTGSQVASGYYYSILAAARSDVSRTPLPQQSPVSISELPTERSSFPA